MKSTKKDGYGGSNLIYLPRPNAAYKTALNHFYKGIRDNPYHPDSDDYRFYNEFYDMKIKE